MSKITKAIKKFFINNMIEKTQRSTHFMDKRYGEKVVVKTSIKSILGLLFLSLFGTFCIFNYMPNQNNKLLIFLFCAAIILYPVYLLFQPEIKLILTKDGISFGNNPQLFKWDEIQETTIEVRDPNDVAESYRLLVKLQTNEIRKTALDNLNFSAEEISHMVEYFKAKEKIRDEY
ncbi:hypothetical protein [Flavobacterium hungaricum]|uniref:Uncharacterized protein n=1 Tax=Flavobacterium hungaricum TaxID=2082725 RepID=A0ABR9TQL7_9FLAO|nr:hypothetical protein [Flavobacterium hungaricum]MBE8727628.1 hypothetical protein [Flavobacterium hungaricum]